jgi:hypothetical protein
MIVSIIRDSGRGAKLVAWTEEGHPRRSWVPSHLISPDLEVSLKVLRESAPYGLPFDHIIKSVTITADAFSDALHRRNIWTQEDVMRNPDAVSKALIAAAGLSVSGLQSSIREFLASEVQSDGDY